MYMIPDLKSVVAVFALKQTAAVTEKAEQVSSEPIESVSTVFGAGMERAGFSRWRDVGYAHI